MKIDLARSPREIQVVAARATSNKIIIRKGIGMSSTVADAKWSVKPNAICFIFV